MATPTIHWPWVFEGFAHAAIREAQMASTVHEPPAESQVSPTPASSPVAGSAISEQVATTTDFLPSGTHHHAAITANTRNSSSLPTFVSGPLVQNSSSAASQLKRTQIRALAKKKLFFPSGPSGGVFFPPHDAVPLQILQLRDESSLSWSAIAALINARLSASGQTPIHTVNSVYSNYVIARHRRDVAQKKAAMQAKKGGEAGVGGMGRVEEVSEWDEEEDTKLVEAWLEMRSEFWDGVERRLIAKGGRSHEASACKERWEML